MIDTEYKNTEEQKKRLKDAATFLMGNNFVEEGILLESLMDVYSVLDSKIKAGKPICPDCGSKIERFSFDGSCMSTIRCWDCECPEHKRKGLWP